MIWFASSQAGSDFPNHLSLFRSFQEGVFGVNPSDVYHDVLNRLEEQLVMYLMSL